MGEGAGRQEGLGETGGRKRSTTGVGKGGEGRGIADSSRGEWNWYKDGWEGACT